MKKKNKNELPERIKRQIEILSKYYDIDLEKRVITLELCYEKVTEMFDDAVVTTKHFKFKNEILQRISQIMDTFPLEFKINLQFKIDDYEGYDKKEIIESFKDSLEMFHYRIHRVKSSRLLEAVILALVSMAILFSRIFLLNNQIIAENYLVSEMLDITAWVFLWQAVTILFLTPDEYREISFKIITRLNLVSLYEKDQLVEQISQDDIQRHWVQVTKLERTSRRIMILSGAFALATGVMSTVNNLQMFLTYKSFDALSIVTLVISIGIQGVITILGGIGAISIYREKGPFQKFVPVCAILFLITDVLVIALAIVLALYGFFTAELLAGFLVSNGIFIIVTVLYFVSYMILRHVRKLSKKQND